ncbi:hypothetical protein [Stenotrophomonas oahuensis]|uniref:Uncharacterized protein n=1 Tax=Stenotrophomonas oahuensis TaxID=3003271 RepID=A0ABY9YSQ0_9GAMM|nr:hypothetical protein [Stenotrophomonas sp. A5586]WNH53204.1 hypothetical protein PDM29_02710 [Stenotrophomonas sp. A5586]
MTTPKTPVKNAAHKTAVDRPNPFKTFETTEERLKYLYGNMTPQESLEILHEAGILTPEGRLSPEYK